MPLYSELAGMILISSFVPRNPDAQRARLIYGNFSAAFDQAMHRCEQLPPDTRFPLGDYVPGK